MLILENDGKNEEEQRPMSIVARIEKLAAIGMVFVLALAAYTEINFTALMAVFIALFLVCAGKDVFLEIKSIASALRPRSKESPHNK